LGKRLSDTGRHCSGGDWFGDWKHFAGSLLCKLGAAALYVIVFAVGLVLCADESALAWTVGGKYCRGALRSTSAVNRKWGPNLKAALRL